MANGLWEADVWRQFRKNLISITSTGTTAVATFEDSSIERGNLIVGCEGSRSKVRAFLVGPEKTTPMDTGMTIINHSACCFTAEEALLFRKNHPVATCFYDPEIDGIFLLTGTNESFLRPFISAKGCRSDRTERSTPILQEKKISNLRSVRYGCSCPSQ